MDTRWQDFTKEEKAALLIGLCYMENRGAGRHRQTVLALMRELSLDAQRRYASFAPDVTAENTK